MKLRTKLILFVTLIVALFVGGLLYYLNLYLKSQLKQTTMSNFRAIAEISEGAYFAFTNTIKTRTIDWSSDGYIRETVEKITSLETAKKEKEKLIKELNTYLKERKIIYDPNVVIIDILDKEGIVLASSRETRLGVNEKKEEQEKNALRFQEAIESGFGEAFVRSVVEEKDESSEPMIHSTARIFSTREDSSGNLKPLEAVLFLHFANTKELGEVLTGQWQKRFGAQTGQAFFERYQTADMYLVNQNHLMASPSRFKEGAVLKDRVETIPVKACFESGEEIATEYPGLGGKPVLGVSMCLKQDGLVLIAEVTSQEVFSPIGSLQRRLILAGIVIFILSGLGIFFLTGWLLKELEVVIDTAKEVGGGNFAGRAKISSPDEIGRLAYVFNQMLDSLDSYQKELKQSNLDLVTQSKEVARRNESLENTEKAMLNILEDARELEEELKVEKAGVEKKVEERTRELGEEQAKLKASINSLQVGFIMADTQNHILMINQIAEQLFCPGPANRKCDMATIHQNLKESLDLMGQIKICLEEKKSFETREVVLEDRFLHLLLAPIIMIRDHEEVIGIVILAEDISEAKILERSKDEFFSIASHELRTPLTAIKGNTSLIEQFYGGELKKNKDLWEMIEDIHQSSIRLISIVNDFLDISRLETGKIQFKSESIDLVSLIQEVAKEYVTNASQKSLYLKFDPPKAELPPVLADRDRVKQVLINLIGNSLKFTDKGGVTLGVQPDGQFLKLSVTDTGRGIPPDGQKLLFHKFQQTGSSIYTRDVAGGTGLGLYISRMIVEGMGGKVNLEKSEAGKGSIFTFTLPVVKK